MEHWFKKQRTGSGHTGGLTLEAVVRREGWLHFFCKGERTEAGKGRGPSKHIFSHAWVAGLRPALNNCLMNQEPSHLVVITRQGDWGSTCSSQGPFQNPVEVVYQVLCSWWWCWSWVGCFLFFVAPGLSCSIRALGCGTWELFSWLGDEPGPLPWDHGLLTTGPPGKSFWVGSSVSSFWNCSEEWGIFLASVRPWLLGVMCETTACLWGTCTHSRALTPPVTCFSWENLYLPVQLQFWTKPARE